MNRDETWPCIHVYCTFVVHLASYVNVKAVKMYSNERVTSWESQLGSKEDDSRCKGPSAATYLVVFGLI